MPYQSNPFFDGQEQAPPGALELALKKRLLARQALAQRNVAAVGPQGPQGLGGIDQASMARRRMQDYQRFGAGGNGVVLRQPPIAPQAMANIAPQAGAAIAKGTMGGTSEVGGGLDPAMRQRMQAAFAQRAQREGALHNQINQNTGESGLSQGDMARRRAEFLAANGGRPSTAKNNAARLERKLAMIERMNKINAAPQIALAMAQNGANPAQAAQANYHNAMADAIRQQGAGAPGMPPPSEPLPEGHQQLAPGVVRRPQSSAEKYWEWAMRGGVGNGERGVMGNIMPRTSGGF